MRPSASRVVNPLELVSEMIGSSSASWDKELVVNCFVKEDSDTILGMLLCSSVVDDFWS
jgi:hypothetical protein